MSQPSVTLNKLGKRYVIRHAGEGTREAGYMRVNESLEMLAKNVYRRCRGRRSKTLRGSKEAVWAVRNLSFEAFPGERIGLVGHNGAGKSTLLKLLSRITVPTRGSFTLNGHLTSLLEVGTGFHQELTGRENVFLNGSILGMSRREILRKFDQIVAFSGVERFLDTPVKRYSSGMQVRLAFSIAAHLDSEIMIVDEVLAVGDVDFQRKCINKMEEIVTEQGRTVLFVSHNIHVLRRFCSRLIFMEQGRMTEDTADVQAALDRYEERYGAEVQSKKKVPETTRDPVPTGQLATAEARS